jgi:hypothetical protein
MDQAGWLFMAMFVPMFAAVLPVFLSCMLGGTVSRRLFYHLGASVATVYDEKCGHADQEGNKP